MRNLRIIIDGRMYNESGIGRYIRNLISQLQVIDKKNEYFILHLKGDYDQLIYHNNFHKVLAGFRWYGAREQFKLPKLLKLLSPDLVHFPHFNVPIFYRGKFVVTIHDLIHQHFSMQRATTHGSFIYKLKQFGYKKVFAHAIRNSQKILVPSEFVKLQLIEDWYVDRQKIIITPEAADNNLATAVSRMKEEVVNKTMKKFAIRPPYIFYVGNAHPHKNVDGLIRTFLKLRKNHRALQLVLAGTDHYFWQRIKKENQHEGLIYTGYVDDEELVALYKNASCFVQPSFEEGFGIPLLEAMACFCPVVSSNAGALPEVGGDACLYFNPYDVDDMVDKISQVLDDEKLRKELIEKGLKRVKWFSWEKLAKKTLEVYEKAYSNSP